VVKTTSETSVDNNLTRQYNPEDSSEQIIRELRTEVTSVSLELKTPDTDTGMWHFVTCKNGAAAIGCNLFIYLWSA
jgi:hypothetical protein